MLHKQAIKKIINDHADIQGFSRRNITRYLPSDNPSVPRRVKPSWPKKSITHNESKEKSSVNKQYEDDLNGKVDKSIARPSALDTVETSITSNVNIEEVLTKEDEKQESVSGVTHLQEIPDQHKIKDLNNMISNASSVTAEEVVSAMNTSVDNVDFEFSLYIEEIQQHLSLMASDYEQRDRLWINGSVNKVTGKIIEIKLGRMEQNSF